MSTMQTMQPLTNEQAYAKLRAYLKQLGYTEAAKELKFCYGADYNKMLGHWQYYTKNKQYKREYDNYV